MARKGKDIQIDNGGFVRIHNDILELLARAPLRGQQFRCLMFLFRKTYGFNRKEAKIRLAEWAEGTGMKRQNVWRELQVLLACNVIYAHSEGEKRAMTWGFNKRHEQWQFQSVIADDDKSVIVRDYRLEQSVIADDYSDEKSVIKVDDKSVITSSHARDLKDNKDKSKQSSLLANDDDDAIALVRLAYQAVCKVGPPLREETGRATLILATELIEQHGYAECVRGVSTLKERNSEIVKKNRHGISAPLPYLRTILDDKKLHAGDKGFEPNAWQVLLNQEVPDYMKD